MSEGRDKVGGRKSSRCPKGRRDEVHDVRSVDTNVQITDTKGQMTDTKVRVTDTESPDNRYESPDKWYESPDNGRPGLRGAL